MIRQRVTLTVEVDLDPCGFGLFSAPEHWAPVLQKRLDDMVGHYHPTVTLVDAKPV